MKPETTTAAAVVAAPNLAPAAAVEPTPVAARAPKPTPVVAAPTDGTESRIGAGLKIRGEISGSADMFIDGDVEGIVRVTSGRLTVGAAGRVRADLEAREIFVHGVVVGNLKATDRVQVGSSGSVQGSVVTARIGIEDGARLRGKVETSSGTDSRETSTAAGEPRALRAAAGRGESE